MRLKSHSLFGAGLIVLAISAFNCIAADEPAFRRGVNIAGAEFGEVPGIRNKNYTYNNEATFKYFAQKGFDVLRVPIKWERIQPSLSGALDPTELNELKKNVTWAKTHGSSVLIDIHNYGGYRLKVNGKLTGCLIDNPVDGEIRVTTADFSDLWVRLSKEFKDEPAVYGYGLMNEPHGMGVADWKVISNAVVKAIRDSGDTKLILVAGEHWSNAGGWEKYNGPQSWITDPANNFIYEAHCYFDSDSSGSYKKSYDKELAGNPKLEDVGRNRVKGFIEWCSKNKVRGFLGEFGVPRDDPRWNVVLENFMQALDEAGFGATYWAAGTYWGNGYALTIQPTDNYTVDRPQMQVMLKHLSKTANPKPEEKQPKPESP
jgi:endoglucanase